MKKLSLLIIGMAALFGVCFGVRVDASQHKTKHRSSPSQVTIDSEGHRTPIVCEDNEPIRQAQSLVQTSPLRAIEMLHELPNCDDKFALLYRAEAQIAQRTRGDFYYGSKIYPRGWHDRGPNVYEKYVMENPEHFYPASEGGISIHPNNYWLAKVRNSRHEIFGDFDLDGIQRVDPLPLRDRNHPKREVHLFDPYLWVDSESPVGEKQLLETYRNWVKKWPNHRRVPLVKKRIREIETYIQRYQGGNAIQEIKKYYQRFQSDRKAPNTTLQSDR